jgi:hypothetical protein
MNVGNNFQSNFQSFGFFVGQASQQINMAPMQQLQQVQSLLQNAFSAMTTGLQNMIGSGNMMPKLPSPGFVGAPNMQHMGAPMSPAAQGSFMGGGFMASGTIGPNGLQFNNFNSFGIGGATGITQAPQPKPKGIKQTKDNPPAFETPGGYKIEAEGKSAAWKITTPEGKTTRIWGDPHVHESDGTKWDFKKDMSFVLPDGTKITARTTPPRANGYTVTAGIDIMNGSERASIDGIDKNKPTTGGVKNDRWAVDAKVKDGDYAVLGKSGDDWFLNGKNEIVGSSKAGEVLHTRAGSAPEGGVTGAARRAMRDPANIGQPNRPNGPFGGMNFIRNMFQQILKTLMKLLMPQMQLPMLGQK